MKKIGRVVSTLWTSSDNPRNGEASFCRLKDGSIMLAYSRFGGEGGDHDSSRLVCVLSDTLDSIFLMVSMPPVLRDKL